VRDIRLEFISRLYFAQKVSPERILPMLETQITEVQNALTKLSTRQRELPDGQIFNRLSLQLRIQQLKSVVDWLDECRKEFLYLPLELKK
jgi:hypothetical protein